MRRTLCECVDWNHTISAACLSIIGRTLCECVDWNIHVNVKVWSAIKSHSLWVRGLKFIKPVVRRINNLVALLVSAWIEICASCNESKKTKVALLVRRGLKSSSGIFHSWWPCVALLVSAWIEIAKHALASIFAWCRTPCDALVGVLVGFFNPGLKY